MQFNWLLASGCWQVALESGFAVSEPMTALIANYGEGTPASSQ